MRMRQYTPRQPPADIRITPHEYKPGLDVSLKHDDLYVRAWECDYDNSIFDAENINATPINSHEFPVQYDLPTEGIKNTPGTTHECSPQTLPQTEELSDVTDTYPDTEPDMEASSEKPNKSPNNPRSFK